MAPFVLVSAMHVRCLILAVGALGWTAGPSAAQGAPAAPKGGAEAPCADEVQAVIASYRAAAADEGFVSVLPYVDAAYGCLGAEPTASHVRVNEYESVVLARLEYFGRLLDALDYYFEHLAPLASTVQHAEQLERYAYVLTELNALSEGLAAYAEAASLADRLPPQRAIWRLSETGERFRSLNRLDEAERYLSAADSILAASEDVGPFYQALLSFRQGQVHVSYAEVQAAQRTERLRAAVPLLEAALPAFRAYPYSRQPILAVLTELSTVHRRLGEVGKAERYLDELADLDINAEQHPSYFVTYYDERSRVLSARGDHDGARRAALRALHIAEETGELENLQSALFALGAIAEAEARSSAAPSASAERMSDAEAYYLRAGQVAADSRRRLGLLDVSPAAWEIKQAPLRALTRLYLEQGRVADAFVTLDATRARYLADLRRAAARRTELVPRQRAALDSLHRAQEDARRALDGASLPVAERSRLHTVVQQAQVEIDRLTIARSPDDAGPDDARASVPALQEALRQRDQVVLAYFFEDEASYVFALTPDTLAVVAIDGAAVRSLIEQPAPWNAASPTGFDLRRLHQLYAHLVAPVAPLLHPGASLVVIPEGPLGHVPFGALTTAPHERRAYATAPYLLRQYPVSVVPSAASLLDAPAREGPTLPLLALGRSTFEGAGATAPVARAARDGFPDLPLVARELRVAHEHLGGHLLLDDDATKAAFFAHAPAARVLHIASHALVDRDAPMSSLILLAPSGPGASTGAGASDDGVLYLSELRASTLAAELVLLSACSTARGAAHLSEGMIGLHHAFQAAGARSVLATLWPVNDAAMTALADAFYGYLADGLPKDRALQRAQLDYLDAHAGAAAHPAYWAALVLQGDAAPLRGHGLPRWAWALGGLALLALCTLLLRRLSTSRV